MKFASKFQDIAPSTDLDAPSSSSQNTKDKHDDSLLKNVRHPNLLPLLNAWGLNSPFSKIYLHASGFVLRYKAHCFYIVLILCY